MPRNVYRIVENSLQARFFASRAKVRMYAGGFANGKTSAACIEGLNFAKDYPGSNGLIARSTYPKLNDTIRKEWLKWCPPDWIKSFPMSANGTNTCTLINGTSVNFRYIQQQGKGTGEATTSNLLSATYDWAIIDQIEDPEIVHKDFLDILGRMRGSTRYIGDDPTMPATGPRHLIITCNPTRNWVFKQLVHPIHVYLKTGRRLPELLWEDAVDAPMLELFEGATRENQDNLEEDFIRSLESAYRGQMRDRFLLGKWAAYEGLVYPEWDDTVNIIEDEQMRSWFMQQYAFHRAPSIIEGYDYGLAVPACYMIAFVDVDGSIHILDGFYEKEMSISHQADRIKKIRRTLFGSADIGTEVFADPSIFRRGPGGNKLVGKSVADMFKDEDIRMTRGNNDIQNGIVKCSSYMAPAAFHQNPYTLEHPAPRLYVNASLNWFSDEINGYYWRRDSQGDFVDMPIDKNDHAMDTLKYMLSRQPIIPIIKASSTHAQDIVTNMWHEQDERGHTQKRARHSHGR